MIHIDEPVWNDRSIGVAEDKIEDYTKICIDYVDKSGKKVYPHIYGATREKLMVGKREPAKGCPSVMLRKILIKDLDIVCFISSPSTISE